MLTVKAQTPSTDKSWEVVFLDDFNTFNTNRWNVSNEFIHTPSDPQIYLNSNTYLDGNGNLVLRCTHDYYYCSNCSRHDNYYTSGDLNSNQTYQYGYFEMICKLPKGSGFWPAFWLWNERDVYPCWYNEIDIFEMKGANEYITTNNLHWYYNCPIDHDFLPTVYKSQSCLDYSLSYHSYSVEWDPDKIVWFLDGVSIRRDPNIYGINNPLYIIANFSISPFSPDTVNATTPFPSYMYIDAINVYRLNMDCNTDVNEIADFDNFYFAVKKSITLSGATIIPQNSKITLRATDYILLQSGFEVPLGAEFCIEPTSCY